MKKIIIITAFLALFSACSRVEVEKDIYFKAGVKSINPEIEAPDFTLPDLNGEELTLSTLRGRVVIINFWAHWCGPCIEEMPSIHSLYNQTKDQDIEVITINIGEGIDIVQPYITDNSFKFTVLLDHKKEVANQYGVRSIPSTYIINKNGSIVAQKLGAYAWDNPQILEIINGLAK